MYNILYFGNNNSSSTSFHRAMALERLGSQVEIFNPKESLTDFFKFPFSEAFHYRTGYVFLQKIILKWISEILDNSSKPDIIWVDSGEYFGPLIIKKIKKLKVPVILFNVDDPTGNRDGNRFFSLVKALPLYDFSAFVREETVEESKKLGAKNTLHVWRSYDEIMHAPFLTYSEIKDNYKSDVVFIGTWMRYEKRDEFILELIKKGVPISIWGDRWQKSPYWNKISKYHRGAALGGRDYVSAIQGAKICIGFLSKGNRDLHTQRTMEVPYAGGLLCAQRTTEHIQLYREGIDAVFWDDVAECATVCKKLLNDDKLRESIRISGAERVRTLNVGNEDICQQILLEIDKRYKLL